MRRDYFTLTVDGMDADDPQRPVVTITYEGPVGQLESRLTKADSVLESDEIDVAFRLKEPLDSDEANGVVAIADRVTGEYVFELNATAGDVFSFVEAAREFGQRSDSESRYRIVLETEDEHLATYDKSTLLVYDADGDLLRGQSLIPSGVEL
ncbi:hypothetical protein GJ631_09295 [Natronomonas sp. CBA1123]|jgi:hypothetical protein|uniref:DUF5793 family protein n=1 Tax=Natronomonas sp. CBA1123 TaxID=2668070 RepID=UPI0012E99828|nr:DUF5793 family protein [Natronomonas sp. CBA1123]MUV86755.1 hypothetical protein [Natronomonas sp. CBA1123]